MSRGLCTEVLCRGGSLSCLVSWNSRAYIYIGKGLLVTCMARARVGVKQNDPIFNNPSPLIQIIPNVKRTPRLYHHSYIPSESL